jgi:hypothetical protein
VWYNEQKGAEFMGDFELIYSQEQRNAMIKKEITRLNKIFKNVSNDEKETLKKLINEAAFMAVTLEETKNIINRDGIIEEYQNGANQKGIKKSSAVEVYDKMVNTYSKVIKQLCDALPETQKEDPAEEIMSYITGLKK